MNLLSQHRNEIEKRFAVKQLALFGSTARGEARTDSDIDLLVEFDGPATFDGYIGLKFYLEDLFGCPIDLVTNRALRPELRPYIEKEAVLPAIDVLQKEIRDEVSENHR
jgi:uncharacterized protein